MAVTMRDVAQHAGVSQRTVSNVVTGSVPVRPETRERVEESIRALGYRTFAPARQLRAGKTSTVALAIPGLSERYFADLAQSVIDQARELDLRVLVVTTEGERDNELEILRGDQLFADGVIMSAVALAEEDETLHHPHFPIVLVGDRGVGSEVAHVGPDNREAARHAVQHLLGLGRRRIALVGAGVGAFRTCELRTEGYVAALTEADIAVDESLLIEAAWDYEGGEVAATQLLTRQPDIDGIFAMNDSSAIGAIAAITRAGRRVPEDVAVIGFDNIREGRQSIPSLTSVGPTPEDVAAAALRELEAQFSGQRSPSQYEVPHRLVERGSTVAGLR